MVYYRRRLPHWIPAHSTLFVTWRLGGSSPPIQPESFTAQNTGRIPFAQQDEWLARTSSGPFWLRDPRVAGMLEETLHYGEAVRRIYVLHAWVIMPNHVHVILEPGLELPRVMHWLKGRTGRRANRILGRTGLPFWQDESYDHWIRSIAELRDLVAYVEQNPVPAGLVGGKEQWPWSSAATPGGRQNAIVRPT